MLIFGNKHYNDFLGIAILDCPHCRQKQPFGVYRRQKKLTFYFIPTFAYADDLVAACGSCGYQYEVPESQRDPVKAGLMSKEQFRNQYGLAAEDARHQPDEPGTKTCPYCAEIIKAEATYCRYCHRDLAPA